MAGPAGRRRSERGRSPRQTKPVRRDMSWQSLLADAASGVDGRGANGPVRGRSIVGLGLGALVAGDDRAAAELEAVELGFEALAAGVGAGEHEGDVFAE